LSPMSGPNAPTPMSDRRTAAHPQASDPSHR
jgi:hypothetical protein